MADLTEKTAEQVELEKAEQRKKIIKYVVIAAVALLVIWLAKKYVFK